MTNFGTLCHLPMRLLLHLLYPGVRVVNFCNAICPITMHALQQSDLKQSEMVTDVAQLTELKTVDRLLNIVIRNSLKFNRTTTMSNDSKIEGRSMFLKYTLFYMCFTNFGVHHFIARNIRITTSRQTWKTLAYSVTMYNFR